jgi:hypothetical protein
MVQPTEGERYFLQILLTHVSGATSFDSLKTVNGQTCRTFKEACIQLGLFQDDCEWDICLREASIMQTGRQLRHLFATHKSALCEDLLYCVSQISPSQTVTLNNAIENEALNR